MHVTLGLAVMKRSVSENVFCIHWFKVLGSNDATGGKEKTIDYTDSTIQKM